MAGVWKSFEYTKIDVVYFVINNYQLLGEVILPRTFQYYYFLKKNIIPVPLLL